MNVYRYEENPLITPKDVTPYHEGFEVIGAFNAAVTSFNDEILLILRVAERPISPDENTVSAPVYDVEEKKVQVVELKKDDPRYDFSDPRVIKHAGTDRFAYLTSISYLRLARSKDGRTFTIDEKPLVYPSNIHEIYGIEDPRVTKIDDTYYIYFSAVSPMGIGESMVSTKDFEHFEHHGMIFSPENKDVTIFPEKINGKYYALHRPVPSSTGKPQVWIAESENLIHWGNHQFLFGVREGKWDEGRIGASAVPFKTEKGWLEIYHGADRNSRYCLGAVLFDLNDPTKIIARSDEPILEPETDYEISGFFGNVVFSCGALVEGDIVKIYYGVADEAMACAELKVSEILDSLTYL